MSNEQIRINWVETKLTSLPKGLRILDAGAGEQQYKKFCSHLNYVSQDFAQYIPSDSNNGLQMPKWDYGKLDIVSDIISIPEPNESFDAILCTEVFEHISNPILAIKEFGRLLKKDGTLILTAPFCSMTHFAPHHYYSGFNRFFYEKHLAENNFKIECIETNGDYFKYIHQEINRMPFIAEQYLKQKPNFIQNIAIKIVSKMLFKFTQQKNSSDELLNFGFHIIAKKI
ncbi:MAG: class I SAM-dependent methyltransferase [Bacteroidetes bacterium]|nr:class I SAM-dependent methyltransferase [Bacteroidota bacterium]